MPIRLCQKCGLKVLIDESQGGINPFFCQRCTTAMKGQENAGGPAPLKNPTPSPVASMSNRSDPAAPSVGAPGNAGAAKPATVRVLCPYCKASFNGRVPQKPARGSCPVCQKELILLPNGDIKPAAGFDLNQWQNEPAADRPLESMPESEPAPQAPKESGTRLLVKKYAAEQPPPAARPAAKRAEPARASADSDSPDEVGALPGWLDDSGAGGGQVKPQPETDMNVDVVEPKKDDFEDRNIKVEDPPPRARSPVVAKMPTLSSGRPPAAVAPPPAAPEPEVDLLPPDPPPPPPTARKPLGRAPGGDRKPAPVAVAGETGETGSGKVFLALFLVVLPLAACAGLLASRDKLTNNKLIDKVGAMFSKGLIKLDLQLFPPKAEPKPKIEEKRPEPEPPPKEEPPKPDPDQQKKDEAAMSTLYTLILREQRDLKQSSVAATPEQQKQLDQVRKDIEAKKDRLKQQQDVYRKMYGREYDPANQ
jgi:hypothetical protein